MSDKKEGSDRYRTFREQGAPFANGGYIRKIKYCYTIRESKYCCTITTGCYKANERYRKQTLF